MQDKIRSRLKTFQRGEAAASAYDPFADTLAASQMSVAYVSPLFFGSVTPEGSAPVALATYMSLAIEFNEVNGSAATA
jgi:hypothetical protein